MDHWRCRPSLAGLAGALTNLDALSTDRLLLSSLANERSTDLDGLGPTKAYPACWPITAFRLLPKMELVPAAGPNSKSPNCKVKAFSDDTDVNRGLA